MLAAPPAGPNRRTAAGRMRLIRQLVEDEVGEIFEQPCRPLDIGACADELEARNIGLTEHLDITIGGQGVPQPSLDATRVLFVCRLLVQDRGSSFAS
jgi:hypothetical protein